MRSLARKIVQAKWQAVDGLRPDEIGAEAVTGCLKAQGNELSLWETDADDRHLAEWSPQGSDPEISDVLLAIASNFERLARIDIVLLSRSAIEAAGLTLRSTPEAAKTMVEDVRRRHVDLVGLDLVRLSNVAQSIADRVGRSDSVRRFPERDVGEALKQAIQAGRLDASLLEPDLLSKLST